MRACLNGDETESPEVRACVVERARALKLRAPRQTARIGVTPKLTPPGLLTRGLCN